MNRTRLKTITGIVHYRVRVGSRSAYSLRDIREMFGPRQDTMTIRIAVGVLIHQGILRGDPTADPRKKTIKFCPRKTTEDPLPPEVVEEEVTIVETKAELAQEELNSLLSHSRDDNKLKRTVERLQVRLDEMRRK